MREDTLKKRERGCQMRHFRAIAQDLAALEKCHHQLSFYLRRSRAGLGLLGCFMMFLFLFFLC